MIEETNFFKKIKMLLMTMLNAGYYAFVIPARLLITNKPCQITRAGLLLIKGIRHCGG